VEGVESGGAGEAAVVDGGDGGAGGLQVDGDEAADVRVVLGKEYSAGDLGKRRGGVRFPFFIFLWGVGGGDVFNVDVEGEGGALAGLGFKGDAGAEEAGELLGDGQAQAGAGELGGAGEVALVEGFEDFFLDLAGHADAGVVDGESNGVGVGAYGS